MSARLRLIGCGLTLALATSGCAPLGHYLVSLDTRPQLEARGPGNAFPTIEAAAVDALVYAYLQARDENDMQRMRAGTIYPVESGYSYGEVHVANPYPEYVISYPLKPRDVARFHMYPIVINRAVNRRNERPTPEDLRSVAVEDPLHRPLFILHPSLAIHEYHPPVHEFVAVTDLRRPKRAILIAGE